MKTRYFKVKGKVQGVMFRQTFIRAAIKRGLKGGATNTLARDEVLFYLSGEESAINDLTGALQSGKEINSWGARIESLTTMETLSDNREWEVTTENVDDFDWNPNVEMYI